ncbi:hypothetical protein [Plantactinospora sp. BB1]|nr:hypothetical protein [Plantactinospora sp. BB1]
MSAAEEAMGVPDCRVDAAGSRSYAVTIDRPPNWHRTGSFPSRWPGSVPV